MWISDDFEESRYPAQNVCGKTSNESQNGIAGQFPDDERHGGKRQAGGIAGMPAFFTKLEREDKNNYRVQCARNHKPDGFSFTRAEIRSKIDNPDRAPNRPTGAIKFGFSGKDDAANIGKHDDNHEYARRICKQVMKTDVH